MHVSKDISILIRRLFKKPSHTYVAHCIRPLKLVKIFKLSRKCLFKLKTVSWPVFKENLTVEPEPLELGPVPVNKGSYGRLRFCKTASKEGHIFTWKFYDKLPWQWQEPLKDGCSNHCFTDFMGSGIGLVFRVRSAGQATDIPLIAIWVQRYLLEDVPVCCVDAVVSLPKLLLASLSPSLAASLAQAEEPLVLLPHNTSQEIRLDSLIFSIRSKFLYLSILGRYNLH